jgi:hypothetical protein
MSKKNKVVPITVRFDEKTRKELEKEGEIEGLDLATYIRHLVFTHPKRQKKKP